MKLPPPPGCNAALAERVLCRFLQEEAGKFGFTRGILGLSGGIDSAVVLELAARAYGPENVTALAMPYRNSNPISLELAKEAAARAHVELQVIDITPMADAFIEQCAAQAATLTPEMRLRQGNIMARARMVVLYDQSVVRNALVLGTSNKTELLLGYSTQFGDSAAAINPIGDLYKSQIVQMARHLNVPQGIIDRPPSADLWQGQTDEDEIGFSYDALDSLLHRAVDRRYTRKELLAVGFAEEFVTRVKSMVKRNQYKRRPPVIAKLANRTINLDFRYARDWGG